VKISGFPAGLLSLLDAQNFGEAPNELLSGISPTVDLAHMFALSKQVAISGSNSSITAAGFALMTAGLVLPVVPVGEVWHVKLWSGIVQTVAANQWGGAIAVRLNGLIMPVTPYIYTGNAATPEQAPFGYADDLLLPPGTEIGLYTSYKTGGTAAVASVGCIAARYKI